MAHRIPIESGCPDNRPFLHPKLAKNYGNWKYHDRPRPGVLHHVAWDGDGRCMAATSEAMACSVFSRSPGRT